MNQLLSLVTPAAEMPVTLDECKADLRVQHSAEDSLIEDLIASATDYAQEFIGKKLIDQVWDYSLPYADGCANIWLPLANASAITSIKYYDASDAEQTATLSDYYFYKFEDSAYLTPKSGKSWPVTYSRKDAITIRFTAGYGDIDSVPAAIKRAIRLLVAHWYENRMAVTVGVNSQQVPMGVESLLCAHRIGWVA